MIRVERAALPDGLRAVAYRDHHGNLVVCVSQELDSATQRAAVLDAMRAARRVGWRAGLPPAGIALFLAARELLRHVTRSLKARPVAWGTAATVTATAAAVSAYFLVSPPGPVRPSAGAAPGPSAVAPAPPRGRPPAHPGGGRVHGGIPGHGSSPSPGAGVSPLSDQVVAGPAPGGGQPGPAPTGHSSPPSTGPAPTPSPSPSPSPQPTPSPPADGGLCVRLLGVKICLRL